MRIEKKKYIFEYKENDNTVTLYNPCGGRYLSMPACAHLTESRTDAGLHFKSSAYENDVLTVRLASCSDKISGALIEFRLLDETIEVGFRAEAAADLRIGETELFRCGTRGMYMIDCIKRFAPAPRNNDGINRSFEAVFCDCTMNAYFAPPPLNFAVGNRNGFVAFGLLDLPDSYEYRLTPQLGILAENRGGKLITRKGGRYTAPRLLISFPKSGWDSIALFRSELEHRSLLPPKRSKIPSWWKKPLVVTYGDQMMELQYNWYSDEDWGSPHFNEDWLYMWLNRAEEKLGRTDFTVVIDAFWQKPYSAEARSDKTRFANMRGFIDECHKRGHHVLLWSAPLIDNPDNGFQTLAESFGVLSGDRLSGGIVDGKYYIDFTADNISEYFGELSRRFFGNGDGCLDCDGLKMDFLANLRNPSNDVHYKNPENGIGIKEMYRFYSEFQKAAEKVKPDVCLGGSGCDPRFENVMAMNRLHDIQNVYEERELRAEVSELACPNLIIDSDGAIMLTDWVRETYIKAVVYSTPALYYVERFHDGAAFSDDEMLALGALLSLSGEKTDGMPVRNEDGDWQLMCKNAVTARSFGGEAVYVYDGKNMIHAFSWTEKIIKIPRGNMHVTETESVSVDSEYIIARLKSGKVLKIEVK